MAPLSSGKVEIEVSEEQYMLLRSLRGVKSAVLHSDGDLRYLVIQVEKDNESSGRR